MYRQFKTYNVLLTPFLRDQTITQLRNSGNLRLIRNESIIKQMNQYWSWREVINQISERVEQRIYIGQELSNRIFDKWLIYQDIILNNKFELSPFDETPNIFYPPNLELMTNDVNLIKEYSNTRISVSQSVKIYLWALMQMEKDGLKLKDMIGKEYHID